MSSRTIATIVRDYCGLTSDFADEVDELILQCKADMERVGILADNISDTDPNVISACKLYAAWMRDVCGKGETYRVAYESFRDMLSLDEEYKNVQSES